MNSIWIQILYITSTYKSDINIYVQHPKSYIHGLSVEVMKSQWILSSMTTNRSNAQHVHVLPPLCMHIYTLNNLNCWTDSSSYWKLLILCMGYLPYKMLHPLYITFLTWYMYRYITSNDQWLVNIYLLKFNFFVDVYKALIQRTQTLLYRLMVEYGMNRRWTKHDMIWRIIIWLPNNGYQFATS